MDLCWREALLLCIAMRETDIASSKAHFLSDRSREPSVEYSGLAHLLYSFSPVPFLWEVSIVVVPLMTRKGSRGDEGQKEMKIVCNCVDAELDTRRMTPPLLMHFRANYSRNPCQQTPRDRIEIELLKYVAGLQVVRLCCSRCGMHAPRRCFPPWAEDFKFYQAEEDAEAEIRHLFDRYIRAVISLVIRQRFRGYTNSVPAALSFIFPSWIALAPCRPAPRHTLLSHHNP